MATTLLDETTARAIRDALSAARAGRLADAYRIAGDALDSGGEPAALNAMLGSLLCRNGEIERGLEHLRSAHVARPDDPVIAWNLGSSLAQNLAFEPALEVATAELSSKDPTLRLERLRGFLFQQLERFDEAVSSYERVAAAYPADWETLNNLGNSRRGAGDFQGAVEALRKAVDLAPDKAPVRLNFATALRGAGHIEESQEQLRLMAAEFPSDTRSLVELHALLKLQGREEDALEPVEQAVQRDPSDIDLRLALASHLLALLKTEAAEAVYREAVTMNPSHGQANLGLAVVFELTNRTTELARLVGEAKDRGVNENALNFIRAFDHRRSKRYAEGLAELAAVPEEFESPRRWNLLGQLHQGAGNFDDAFAAFSRMSESQRNDPTFPEQRASRYREVLRANTAAMTSDWAARWRNEPVRDGRPSPVFLVGFPRSGTTLLDTMLMGHPQIEVLEEEPTVRDATKLLPEFENLPAASDEQIRTAREEYFRIAGSLTPMAPGKVLVDKNPLSMNGLPIIRRLFPDARILLALRHPCDVVLSCFVTNFKLNDGMSNFVRLETAAELYDLSFSFFDRSQELLPMPCHTVRYEKLVEDREVELGAAFDFLGLDWHDDVLEHEATARRRGRIKTASYAQVAEPIYSRSSGRWLNYRKHLEPVLPVLEPWVRKFGYSL